MTAQTLQAVFVGESLSSIKNDTIVSAVFTYMMNQNSKSTMPIIHYAQISNVLIAEGDFKKKISEKLLSMLVKFDFEICRFVPSLIEFHIYLNSQ
jgi:hypothetical protein